MLDVFLSLSAKIASLEPRPALFQILDAQMPKFWAFSNFGSELGPTVRGIFSTGDTKCKIAAYSSVAVHN